MCKQWWSESNFLLARSSDNYYDFKNILIVIMFGISVYGVKISTLFYPFPYLEGCNFYSIGLFAQSRQIGSKLDLKGSSEGGNYVKSNPYNCIYYLYINKKKEK